MNWRTTRHGELEHNSETGNTFYLAVAGGPQMIPMVDQHRARPALIIAPDARHEEAGERAKACPCDTLFIDIGARVADQVAKLIIDPGDPVVPATPFVVLPATRCSGKASEDRVSGAAKPELRS